MQKKTNTKKTTKSTNTSSTSSKTTKNTSQKNNTKSNTKNLNSININTDTNKKPETEKKKIILDFKDILKPSLSENINYNLYLELMNNLDKKDDLKTLAICRLILSQDPNNTKIKELHDLIYEEVKNNYYETGELEKPNDEKMDKHMKLNKDGEYEYCFSDESEEED